VAGEWSPKPLFLRGIYFTSSMREGQALDVGLAQALGIDVDSIPGGKEWDKDKAYFLRDMFMGKVFKERGLVTRAANVSKSIAAQRRMVVGISAAAVLLLAGVAAAGYFSFRTSLETPSQYWATSSAVFAGVESGDDKSDPVDIRFIDPKTLTYRGNAELKSISSDADFKTPLEFVSSSAKQRKGEIKPPFIAAPVVGFRSEWTEKQVNAHRAIVERAIVVPLVNACRSKLQSESEWGPEAVGSLAQLVRLQTFALGESPSATDKKQAVIDVDVMFHYVLNKDEWGLYDASKDKILDAVAAAYPEAWTAKNPPAEVLGAKDDYSIQTVSQAVEGLARHVEQLEKDRDMQPLVKLRTALVSLSSEHANIQSMEAFKGPEGMPQSLQKYETFESTFLASTDKIARARADIDSTLKRLGDKDVSLLMTEAGAALQTRLTGYFNVLLGQLPAAGEAEKLVKIDERLAALRGKLEDSSRRVGTSVTQQLAAMSTAIEGVKWLLTPGSIAERGESRAFAAIARGYELASKELRAADAMAATPEDPADAGEPKPTLVAQIGEVTENAKKVRSEVELISGWVPEPGRAAAQTLMDVRSQVVSSMRKAIDIASARRVHELARQAIAAWPTEADGIRALVEDITNARINEQVSDARRLKRPRLPLTPMDKGGEFAKTYFWEAADQVLKDWAEIKGVVEGADKADKRYVLGRDDLRANADLKYLARANATMQYLKDYIDYWRKQGGEDCRPSTQSWSAYGGAFKGMTFDKLCDELEALRKTIREALKVAPVELTKDANDEFANGFEKLDDTKFVARAKAVYTLWATLANNNDAEAARRELLSAMREGRIGEEYFNVYRPDGIRYMNELVGAGVACLVRETKRDLESSLDKLLTDAKAVPLAYVASCDPVRTKPLTTEQVRDISRAAEKLEQATLGQRAANPTGVPEELKASMVSLTGADIMPAGSGAWFAKLKAMAALFGQKELSFTVTYSDSRELPTRSDVKKEDVRGTPYGYASLRVGGNQVGEVFSLTLPTPPEKLKELTVKLPIADGQTTELWLYVSQPQPGQEPAEKIILPGNWSLLQQMMTACGEAAQNDKDAANWRVLVTTKDNKYLWLSLTFNQKLPDRNSWPSTDSWPR